MIIIKTLGGLGNQLFQYVLAQKLIYLGKEVKFDFSQIKENGIKNELTIFDNNLIEATSKEINELGDCKTDILHRIKRKLKIYKKTHIIESASYTFQPSIFELDNVYLYGYWQSDKYFNDIENIIRNKLIFPKITEAHNIQYMNQIQNDNFSVSIHIRRGDYLSKQFVNQYGNICTDEYYDNAIAYIKAKIENPHFYIFSNDLEWAKNKYNTPEFTIISGNSGNISYRDMQLMSMCKHNIIANSSFSWWGAWLNNNPNKIVIAPNKWCNNKPTPDIYPENCLKLN